MSRWTKILPALITFAFALVVTQPLFQGFLLCTDDGYYHINKAVDLEQAIQNGHLFARWMPAMAHGYGYPHFNYYAPLASYILIGFHSLGLIYPAAFHLFLFLCVWLAGWATYALVADWWGNAAGLAAAVVYLTAPYLAFDLMIRGALAETLAFVWVPLVMLTLHRALAASPAATPTRSTVYTVAAALSFAALIYSHNATALGALPLVGGYIALLAWQRRSWGTLLKGCAGIALGLALSARFWLAALLERGLVQSSRLLEPPIFTYYTNFLTLNELLAAPRVFDPLLVNPSPAKGLGLVAFILALLGFAAILRRAARSARAGSAPTSAPDAGTLKPEVATGAFVLVALLGYMILTLPVSRIVWDSVPLLPFIQFPWRLLVAASLCAAILAGAAVQWIPKHAYAIAGSIALIATVSHLSWWYGRTCNRFSEITQQDTAAFEIATYTIGTTAKGEFLPVTVKLFPADLTIAQAIIQGEQPQYLTGAPPETRITVTDPDVLDYRASVTAAAPVSLTFNQFYFPGWRATLDGQPLALRLTPDTGLMLVDLPAGTHALHLFFGDTPIRAIGNSVSAVAFFSLLAGGAWVVARRRTALFRPAAIPSEPRPTPALWLLAAGLGLALLRFAVIDRTSNPLRHTFFDGERVQGVQHDFLADFAGGVRAYGYDLSATTLPADGFLDVSLYAGMRERTLHQYWPSLTIRDAAGLVWSDPNTLPPRWHKEPPDTQYWDPNSYAQWARHIEPFPGTPPGAYQLWGEIFDKQSLQIASLLDAQGNLGAPRFQLSPLTITRPARPFGLEPEFPAAHTFGPMALLGYNVDRLAANAGESLLVTLYWKSVTATQADEMVQLGLLSPDGQPRFSVDLRPVATYPTSAWQPGDQWRGQHPLLLPAALEGGDYPLFVSGRGETETLGTIHVTAPQHNFVRPALQTTSGAVFDGVGVLEGFSIDRAPDTLTVRLIWRAAQTPDHSYSVFVHLQDDTGRIWAQSDSRPANWTRPTTGWVRGEFVTDPHRLTLPADLPAQTYHLYVGLYDPETGARVPVAGPGASVDGRVEIDAPALP